MQNQELKNLIKDCLSNKRKAQKKLFDLLFAYGMSVALRYSKNIQEAEDIINDSYVNLFKNLNRYDGQYPIKAWFRRIIINAAIDYSRKYNKLQNNWKEEIKTTKNINEGLTNLLYEDVLKVVQQLPDRYRKVFNLYAIDGYKHHEIAEMLGIHIGTSKSNYARAKALMQKKLMNIPQKPNNE